MVCVGPRCARISDVETEVQYRPSVYTEAVGVAFVHFKSHFEVKNLILRRLMAHAINGILKLTANKHD